MRTIERNLPWLGRLGGTVLLAAAVTALALLNLHANGWWVLAAALVGDVGGTLAVLGMIAERRAKKRLEGTGST